MGGLDDADTLDENSFGIEMKKLVALTLGLFFVFVHSVAHAEANSAMPTPAELISLLGTMVVGVLTLLAMTVVKEGYVAFSIIAGSFVTMILLNSHPFLN